MFMLVLSFEQIVIVYIIVSTYPIKTLMSFSFSSDLLNRVKTHVCYNRMHGSLTFALLRENTPTFCAMDTQDTSSFLFK